MTHFVLSLNHASKFYVIIFLSNHDIFARVHDAIIPIPCALEMSLNSGNIHLHDNMAKPLPPFEYLPNSLRHSHEQTFTAGLQ